MFWEKVTKEFWETANKPWLDDIIERRDDIRFVSDPSKSRSLFVMENKEFVIGLNGKRIPTIFSQEKVIKYKARLP